MLFHRAIDGIFAAETVPDVVLEIGPHQTLVSPVRQVLSTRPGPVTTMPNQSTPQLSPNPNPNQTKPNQILGASGKQAAVLPTLKKGAPCARRFFEALGKLFELGVQVSLISSPSKKTRPCSFACCVR